MCDYSLMSLPTRLAMAGEELVVHRFPSGSKGLVSPADSGHGVVPFPMRRKTSRSFLDEIRALFSDMLASPAHDVSVTAVCIAPGTRLLLRDIPKRLQIEIGVCTVEKVTFTQITSESFTHRDAVRFGNGCDINLQRLQEGQRVRVLSLYSANAPDPELQFIATAV
jgi:hypothetical protein